MFVLEGVILEDEVERTLESKLKRLFHRNVSLQSEIGMSFVFNTCDQT